MILLCHRSSSPSSSTPTKRPWPSTPSVLSWNEMYTTSRLSFYYIHPSSPPCDGTSLTQFSIPPVSPSPSLATCLVFVLRCVVLWTRCHDYLRTFSPGARSMMKSWGSVLLYWTFLYIFVCDTRSRLSFFPLLRSFGSALCAVWIQLWSDNCESCPGDLGNFVMVKYLGSGLVRSGMYFSTVGAIVSWDAVFPWVFLFAPLYVWVPNLWRSWVR